MVASLQREPESAELREIARMFLYGSKTRAGGAEGTNANTIKTANTLEYNSNAVQKTKAATDNIAFSAGHTQQAVSTKCIYLVCIDAAGTFSTVQGLIVAATATPVCPKVPAGLTPVWQILVETSAAVTFTAGSVDLGDAGVTDDHSDLAWPDTGGSSFVTAGA